ncbi:MAG: hypothetical protein IPH80_32970 [Myxococcales bacterium]|nr:hypothetical protein [Myxococcales bacterium]MBP6842669.1 hypothetical protein [Kofleriaceae bacterium]
MKRLASLTIAGVALAAGAGRAWAQADERDRFYVDKDDDDRDKTLWQGSLTSSSFYYTESGVDGTAYGPGEPPANGSPYARMWTELRAQLDGRHLKGGRWDARIDARARVVPNPYPQDGADPARPQSGMFGDNEYELRELYLVRGGRRSDLFIGRQVIADLGAIKIDGIRLDYAKNRRWTYLGFAGLYPLRGSRSIATDYPVGIDKANAPTGRVYPAAGGFGGAYRTQNSYGALGAVAIVPTSRDGGYGGTGTFERPRLYVTANGYWRRSPALDVWHYLIVDLYGSAGTAATNASGGLQWKPSPRLRFQLWANHLSTEALNVQVRDQLENEVIVNGVVVNNVKVQRIGTTAGRASVSALLGKGRRFELTAALQGRRRPDVVLEAGTADQTLPAAQSLDLHVQAVDRGFYGGLRLEGTFIRTIGLGEASYARSTAQIVRLGASRELKDGKAQVTGDLSWVTTADDNATMQCLPGSVTTCYGSANSTALQANAAGYYRWKRDWFVTGALGVGTQKLIVTNLSGGGVPQATTLIGQAFVRIGYKF